ncbi:uncharacterized protein LOC136087428 [Hydra vulgaris]|uniref:Uncharacterized protein LOC136087428 n=1 Tax=Hydra vulgaris TaxID=6087 RepID=A0ABM4CWG6_HYDVU
MLICCIVAKFHWTLAIIKPDDKTIHYINPMGEPINSIKKEESKWNRYLQQRYGIIEKFRILTSPHAKQADSISCGVFCLKFAENYINGEELVTTFPIEEVNAYRKKVVQLLLDEGGQKCWQDSLCRICRSETGPKTRKNQKKDKWIKCDFCIPNRWYHIGCIVFKNKTSFCCEQIYY